MLLALNTIYLLSLCLCVRMGCCRKCCWHSWMLLHGSGQFSEIPTATGAASLGGARRRHASRRGDCAAHRIKNQIKREQNTGRGENDTQRVKAPRRPRTRNPNFTAPIRSNRTEPAGNSWGFAETFRTAMHCTRHLHNNLTLSCSNSSSNNVTGFFKVCVCVSMD